MITISFSYFSDFLLHLYQEIRTSESDKPDRVEELLHLSDKNKELLLNQLIEKESIKVITNNIINWKENHNSDNFLKLCSSYKNYANYSDFIFNELIKSKNVTNGNIMIQSMGLFQLLDAITPKNEDKFKLNDNITISISSDAEPESGSFAGLLAQAIKKVANPNQPLTINNIAKRIIRLSENNDYVEQQRKEVIHHLCELYRNNFSAKNSSPKNYGSDIKFLELVGCNNIATFLNAYLPLSSDGRTHSSIYQQINNTYTATQNTQTDNLSSIKISRSTLNGTIIRNTDFLGYGESIIIKEKATSFSSVLEKILPPTGDLVVPFAEHIHSLNPSQKQQLLDTLRREWVDELEQIAASFNKQQDIAFLERVGEQDYASFLKNTCFPEACDVDNFLFDVIGLATASRPSTYIAQQAKSKSVTNNNNNNNNQPVKKTGWFETSKIAQKAQSGLQSIKNKVHDERTNDERLARFAKDKRIIRKAVNNFIGARLMNKTPDRHISLVSTGADIAVEGVKKVVGAIITPVKVVFLVVDSAKSIRNFLDEYKHLKQYDNLFTSVGRDLCDQAIDKALERIELTMRTYLEELSDFDYNALIRYVINKMTYGFDTIAVSLIKDKASQHQWNAFSQPEKQQYIEKVFFTSLFEPVKDTHKHENITLRGETKQIEMLMTLTPCQSINNELVYRISPDTKKLAIPTTYKGPYFNNEVFNLAMEGKDLVQIGNTLLC